MQSERERKDGKIENDIREKIKVKKQRRIDNQHIHTYTYTNPSIWLTQRRTETGWRRVNRPSALCRRHNPNDTHKHNPKGPNNQLLFLFFVFCFCGPFYWCFEDAGRTTQCSINGWLIQRLLHRAAVFIALKSLHHYSGDNSGTKGGWWNGRGGWDEGGWENWLQKSNWKEIINLKRQRRRRRRRSNEEEGNDRMQTYQGDGRDPLNFK